MGMIHPTAIVETDHIGKDVFIGPYCYVGSNVYLEEAVALWGHCSIGAPPEMRGRARNPEGIIRIGAGTEIREYVTINMPVGDSTEVGPGCYFMAGSHVAHDCQVGPCVVLSRNAVLGGHSIIGGYTVIGINASVHQHSKIGKYCMIGMCTPFRGKSADGLTWAGDRARIVGVNEIGIRRAISDETLANEVIDQAEQRLPMRLWEKTSDAD